MLYTIIAVFALAAIMGTVLLSHVLRSRPAPKGVLIVHGLFAATGLGLLIYYVTGNEPNPMEALVLFVVAALGGFIMVSRELTGKPVPKWLAVVHGLAAVTAFILLIVFAMNGETPM